MPRLTIDGRSVDVPPGAMLLDAARALGIDVPALCAGSAQCGGPPSTSCLACVVRVNGQSRLVPSCATRAEDGMAVESETEPVRAARRTALELLLSDHLGDCLSPCHRICPLGLFIPRMLRQIAAGKWRQAVVDLKREVPFPAILGRVCKANCEQGCRRSAKDDPVAVRNIELHLGDRALAPAEPYIPECRPATGRKVAVVGAGCAGLSAAYFLLRDGHACTVFEKTEVPGGRLRTQFSEDVLPRAVFDAEMNVLKKMGLDLRLGAAVSMDVLRRDFDAVLLTPGADGLDASWGVAGTPKGLTINVHTHETNLPGVFAAGDVVRTAENVAHVMGEGKAGAECISRHLSGVCAEGGKAFSVKVGKLREGEIDQFMPAASAEARHGPATGVQADFTAEEAAREAARCVHCDCRKFGGCLLRKYSDAYGAEPGRFKGERRTFEIRSEHPHVYFEPGKCIACGTCIRIAQAAAEELGLSYVGRGFDVRVAVPFNEGLDRALRTCAAECVKNCPTGALAPKDV